MSFQRRQKFNAKPTGEFRTKSESDIAKALKKVKGLKVEYENFGIPYKIPRVYFPDFIVTTPTGRTIFIEVKGYLRPEDKQKMVCVKRDNPDRDIRIVFMSKNMQNMAWASKHGFPYSIKEVPKEWLT